MLGTELAALRRSAGLSQSALAMLTGLSPDQVGRVESGRRRADAALVRAWTSACNASDRAGELLSMLPAVLVL